MTDLLGEGGMAKVWRAWDREQGVWCALKVLRPRYAQQREFRRRFIDEARTLIRLEHRNLIQAWDVVEGENPFLVMEVADAGTLKDWVTRNGPMPSRMAVGLAIQVCKGLGAAHRAGVVHRDVKPHNVLINRKGVCKVSDFGIARIRRADGSEDVPDASTMPSTTGDALGTLGYMAPEQQSNPRAADVRVDVYGVAATLYDLVIGEPNPHLFRADQNPEILAGIHEVLRPVLLRAAAYRADQRYAEIGELSLALFHSREFLPDDPVDTKDILDGIGPEPDPPAGVHAASGGGEGRIDDLEVPTTIRRPSKKRGPRSTPPPTPVPPGPRRPGARDDINRPDPRSTDRSGDRSGDRSNERGNADPRVPVPSLPPSPTPPSPGSVHPPSLPTNLAGQGRSLDPGPVSHDSAPERPRPPQRPSRPPKRPAFSLPQLSFLSEVDITHDAPPRTRLWVVASALFLMVCALWAAAIGWVSASQRHAGIAHDRFVDQVYMAGALRDQLADRQREVTGSVDRTALDAAYVAVPKAKLPETQLRADRAYVLALEDARLKWANNCQSGTTCNDIRRGVQRLVALEASSAQAHADWYERTTHFPGSWLVGLGILDPAPEPLTDAP